MKYLRSVLIAVLIIMFETSLLWGAEEIKGTSFFGQDWLKSIISIETWTVGKTRDPIGSGFIVGTPGNHFALITAKHVVFDDNGKQVDNLVYRFNRGGIWMRQVSKDTLQVIERHFHEVIRECAGKLIDKHKLKLPKINSLINSAEPKVWFPIPGMYGGFSYWLEGKGDQIKLVTESWSRVVEGSGQRHEITTEGSKLVKEGFL